MNRCLAAILSLCVLLVSSCAHRCPSPSKSSAESLRDCRAFLQVVDDTVGAAGARDAADAPVTCFPYLRCNRFLSSVKTEIENDSERDYWVQWMQQLDLSARKKELCTLSDQEILFLSGPGSTTADRDAVYSRVVRCSHELLNHHRSRPQTSESMNRYVHVPDEYSSLMRAAGLYPLASIVVNVVTEKVRRDIKSWFDSDLDQLEVTGELKTFVPHDGVSLSEKEIRTMIEASSRNPLRVPRLDRVQEEELVRHFAPVFVQDVAAAYDRFGPVVWEGKMLAIEPANPTVYYYTSHAFHKKNPILQINYVVWYSKRAGSNAPWIEHGKLDGLTLRISLDTRGKPFMVDVQNNCGCYHFFSPKKEAVRRVVSKEFALDPFVPQWLPEVPPDRRLGIRVNSGWHQVQRLLVLAEPDGTRSYKLVPYDVLLTLPRGDGGTESMFDSMGIAKGSERIEPYIFFPMGIPSVGSMRQRGNHAISLTGRTHFDDPHLFEHNFLFK